MNFVTMAFAIIRNPVDIWDEFAEHWEDAGKVLVRFAIPWLAVATTLSTAISPFVIPHETLILLGIDKLSWVDRIGMGIIGAIIAIVQMIAYIELTRALSIQFDGSRDRGRAAQVAMYSYAPTLVAQVFALMPVFGGAFALAAPLFGIYLYVQGSARLLDIPQRQLAGFVITSIVAWVVSGIIIGGINLLVIMPGLFDVDLLGNMTRAMDVQLAGQPRA
jgi:hypothetical protein